MKQVSKRIPELGVTLLEVLVVVAIMALIAALAAPRVLDRFDMANAKAAQVQMANLKGAVQLFYLDVGRYPSQSEGISALIDAPSGTKDWHGPYTDVNALVDPWGRSYIYEMPGETGAFNILSLGRDGQPGGNRSDSDIRL